MPDDLNKLNREIVVCRKCPRLVAHREAIAKDPPLRYRGQKYWARPLPGFGDVRAKIYIIGLAPAANGGNRTGRIFTGDRSGDWLYSALFEKGLASQPDSISKNDGMKLFRTYICAAVRCAPPDNKPAPQEFENCFPYLRREFELLKDVKVIVALGSIAYNSAKKLMRNIGVDRSFRFPPFAHGQEARVRGMPAIVCSYHPSQQNTFTGKLTREMFSKVFEAAVRLAENSPQKHKEH